jgi:hypothetical protein
MPFQPNSQLGGDGGWHRPRTGTPADTGGLWAREPLGRWGPDYDSVNLAVRKDATLRTSFSEPLSMTAVGAQESSRVTT